jgi:endonuclease/exonuclease/phosphatase family metal-dependent hydrolase
VASHPGIVIGLLTWNLFHGCDAPPGPALHTWRSRLSRRAELGATHAQVNRPLRDEFATALAGWEWDVALLQETPPRWLADLGRASGAAGEHVLTSRNSLAPLRAMLADWNPDLIASNEGGSNAVLVRPPWRIVASASETLARRPERRRLLLVRVATPGGGDVIVACCHLSVPATGRAAAEALRAAGLAVEWADGAPVILGGDLNLRPATHPEAFTALRERFGLAAPTAPHALDHLLARGLAPSSPPAVLPPTARDVPGPAGRAIRLSDHAPVVAAFGVR